MFKFEIGEMVLYKNKIFKVVLRTYKESENGVIIKYDLIDAVNDKNVLFRVSESNLSKLPKYKIVITEDDKEVYSEYSDYISYEQKCDEVTFESETSYLNLRDVITVSKHIQTT